jgi:predicted thioredoxin/glutaredoxin
MRLEQEVEEVEEVEDVLWRGVRRYAAQIHRERSAVLAAEEIALVEKLAQSR